jgi:hypothetical protein
MTGDDGVQLPGDRSAASGVTHVEYNGLTLDLFGSNLETFYLGTLPRWSASNHDYRANTGFGNLGYRLPVHERVNVEFNLTYNLLRTDFARTGRGDVHRQPGLLGEVRCWPTHGPVEYRGRHLREYQQKLARKSDPIVDLLTLSSPRRLRPTDYRLGPKVIAGVVERIGGDKRSPAPRRRFTRNGASNSCAAKPFAPPLPWRRNSRTPQVWSATQISSRSKS